jgi:two-component system cell cycle response regulator DivK
MALLENPRAPLDVLIAEDDCDTRMIVRHLLEGEGYTCAEAEDGRVAVETAQQCPPRLVLLDLMMPEVDGFAAAQQLRSDPRTRDIRIHCVTALDSLSARQAARQAGCNGYLTKPFTPEDLLNAVSVAVHSLRPSDDVFIQAIERLEQTLSARVPGRERNWCKQLRSALMRLEDVLGQQAALMETAEGLFAGADLCRPTLARKVAALCKEHSALLERTRTLRTQVQSAAQVFQSPGDQIRAGQALPQRSRAGPVVDFTALRRAGQQLVAALRRHAEGTRGVLFDSANTDIGVGD